MCVIWSQGPSPACLSMCVPKASCQDMWIPRTSLNTLFYQTDLRLLLLSRCFQPRHHHGHTNPCPPPVARRPPWWKYLQCKNLFTLYSEEYSRLRNTRDNQTIVVQFCQDQPKLYPALLLPFTPYHSVLSYPGPRVKLETLAGYSIPFRWVY